jgi:hypothetical protein
MLTAGIRRLPFIVLAVSAVAAIASAPASATQWQEAEGPFNGEESIGVSVFPSTAGALPITLRAQLLSSPTMLISCRAMSMTGAQIFGGHHGKALSIIFRECKLDEPIGCKVSEELVTAPVVMEAVTLKAGSEPVYLTFRPKSGNNFYEFTLTGECVLAGRWDLTGTAACKLVQAEAKARVKLCDFEETLLNSLRTGVLLTNLKATVGFLLTGSKKGQVWGVSP